MMSIACVMASMLRALSVFEASEAEGGQVENKTLASDTTDAMKNDDPGIEITM